jgi:V-type H+-transporting ATPase subunit a
VFTAVTFPFLFGVMFGDVFHGAILFIIGLYLCLIKPKGFLKDLHKLRYMVLLMGLFSTYCGYIYNDFTSIPLETVGPSCYALGPLS